MYALIVVAGTAPVAVAACDLINAGWEEDNYSHVQVWYQISGEEGDTYYQWLYDWDADKGKWHRFSEGKGWFNITETQTLYISVSGHGSIKIVVEGDNRRERIVDY